MTAASGAGRPDVDAWDRDQRATSVTLGLGFASGADQPTLRDQLADELARHQALLGPMDDARPDVWQARCQCGWDGGDHTPDWKRRYRQHVADALLPLIDADRARAVADAAAEALEQAADALAYRTTSGESVIEAADLRARAAALRAGAGPC